MARISDVAVLDIGSQKIRLLIVERPNNDILSVKAISEIDYSGYMDADWLSGHDAVRAIKQAINIIKSNHKIRTLYVAIPSEFCETRLSAPSVEYARSRRISEADLDFLLQKGDPFKAELAMQVINRSANYYVINNAKKVVEPISLDAKEIKAHLSYIAAKRSVIDFFDRTIAECDIKNIIYTNSTYAEMHGLFEPQIRDKYVLFSNIGYLSTTVAIMMGDALLHMLSFSLGGGHIIAAFVEEFGLTFAESTALFSKVNLSFDANENDMYTVNASGQVISLSVLRVNAVCKQCIKLLAEYINKAQIHAKCDYPAHLKLYTAGEGISSIRGAITYLSKQIGKPVELTYPKIAVGYAKPRYSQAIGLAQFAFEHAEQDNKGFFKRLFK